MKISCCIIVKDDSELEGLKKAISSVNPYVDGIYITANGEKAMEIEEYCASIPNVNYSYLKWKDDFSEQRNFNFNQAPQDSDFIFWMDADDILYGGENLRTIAELAASSNQKTVFLTYWYSCTFNGPPSISTLVKVNMEHMRERLIKPATIKWIGRLHETPIPIVGLRESYTQKPYDPDNLPIAILHTSDMTRMEGHAERNKRILELQLEEEKEKGEVDPRTELYLMKIYADGQNKDDYPKVFELGESYLKKSGWNEERANAYEQMAIVAQITLDNRKAIKLLHNAIAEWPSQPLIYIRLAQAYYNVKDYRSARHWLQVASGMDLENKTGGLKNIQAMKILYSELLMKLAYNVEKDTEKALKAASLLYEELPSEENKEQLLFMQDVNDLNNACRNSHELVKYLKSIGRDGNIVKVLNALPDEITTQPIFVKIRKDITPARKWGRNEICYFANFGGKHFEKWDSTSLDKGIGGSETAVIRLAEKWTEMGYRVTVYGDPYTKGEQNGVMYLPWYYFNYKDSFNIFIQWRSWALASQVKARRFYVDLHDVFSGVDISKEDMEHIDSFMVKSKYHRELAPNIPDEKFTVISNPL